MLDRAQLFLRIPSRRSSALLASALVLAALTGACSKTDGGGGTSTASTGTAAPSASATAAMAAGDAATATADPPPTAKEADAAAAAASAAPSASATPAASGSAAPATSGSATAATPPACGTKPLPDCPTQAWMKANMNPSVSAADFPALATALDKAATLGPPGYTNWVSIAKDGAKAARAQDMTATKASCRTCHEQYKEKFKKDTAARTKKI
jgi:hypothetical protein